MKKVKALVTHVTRPGFGLNATKQQALAADKDTWQVEVTWMTKPFLIDDGHGGITSIRPKKRKHTVFMNTLPKLHSWIEVCLL